MELPKVADNIETYTKTSFRSSARSSHRNEASIEVNENVNKKVGGDMRRGTRKKRERGEKNLLD